MIHPQVRRSRADDLVDAKAESTPPLTQIGFSIVLSGNSDAIARIVRIASTPPHTLISLWVGPPDGTQRKMTLSVEADEARFETLRRRLDRVVDIVRLRVVR